MKPYASSQKGGTLIFSKVKDLATHLALLRSGGYGMDSCPSCRGRRPQLHDYRSRCVQVGDKPTTMVVRIRCVEEGCRATWQLLPGFIPRWLHYNWAVVEAHSLGGPTPRRWGRPPSPKTVKRWRARLASSGAPLKSLVSDAGGSRLRGRSLVGVSTRLDLVKALSCAFEELASWLHKLMPGVRLM